MINWSLNDKCCFNSWLIDKLPGLPTPSHCAPSRSETCISSAAAAKYISVNFSSRKL